VNAIFDALFSAGDSRFFFFTGYIWSKCCYKRIKNKNKNKEIEIKIYKIASAKIKGFER
jgi:hypothetical protein